MSHYRYSKAALTPTGDLQALSKFVDDELSRIEMAFMFMVQNPMPVHHAAPTKLVRDEITFAFADGADWNPGGGRGLYYFDPDLAVWKKVTVT